MNLSFFRMKNYQLPDFCPPIPHKMCHVLFPEILTTCPDDEVLKQFQDGDGEDKGWREIGIVPSWYP